MDTNYASYLEELNDTHHTNIEGLKRGLSGFVISAQFKDWVNEEGFSLSDVLAEMKKRGPLPEDANHGLLRKERGLKELETEMIETIIPRFKENVQGFIDDVKTDNMSTERIPVQATKLTLAVEALKKFYREADVSDIEDPLNEVYDKYVGATERADKKAAEDKAASRKNAMMSEEEYKKWLRDMGERFNPTLGDLAKGELPDMYDAQGWKDFLTNFNYAEARAIVEREGGDPFEGMDYHGSKFYNYINSDFAEKFKANYTQLSEQIAAECDKAYTDFNNVTAYSNKREESLLTLSIIKQLYDRLISAGLVDKKDKNYEYAVGTVYNQTAAPYYDTVFTNDFHEANAGKILFSAKPIDVKNLKAEQFTDVFDLSKGQHIYGIVLADALLTDKAGFDSYNNSNGMIKIDIKSSSINSYIFVERDVRRFLGDRGYCLIDIFPEAENALNEKVTREMGNELLSKLPPREVSVTISFNPGKTVAAEGEFKVKGGNAEKILAETEAGAKAAQINTSKSVELHKAFAKPMKLCKNDEVPYDEIVKAVMEDERDVKRVVAVRLTEGTCGWYLTAYPVSQLPKYRDLHASFDAIYEDTNGIFWYKKDFMIVQYYMDGKYGPSRAMFGGSPLMIAPELVKDIK